MALALCLTLAIFLGLPGQAGATVPAADGLCAPTGDVLVASFLQEVLGSRKRLIQVSIVAVVLGIFFLQWRR